MLTGDWISDNELARSAGIPIDPFSKGPRVDQRLRTNLPGVFAIGNMIHPVDTADIAALDGAAVVAGVLEYLDGTPAGQSSGYTLSAQRPLRWVSPARVEGDAQPPRGRLLLWTDEYRRFPRVVLRQNGTPVASMRLWWPAAPGRVFRVPSTILRGLVATTGDVVVSLE